MTTRPPPPLRPSAVISLCNYNTKPSTTTIFNYYKSDHDTMWSAWSRSMQNEKLRLTAADTERDKKEREIMAGAIYVRWVISVMDG